MTNAHWQDWCFALVAPNTPFDPAVHNRRDLNIESISITESEVAGQAVTKITLTDPVGALNGVGALTNAWLSRYLADGSLLPMVQAHLVTVPTRNEGGASPILSFHASPTDWRTPEAAATAPYQIAPFFCPELCAKDQRANAREILDGWFRTVHCDRASWAFSCPDSFGIAPDIHGTAIPNFVVDEPWNEPGIQTTIGPAPIAVVNVTVSAEWTQQVDQIVDLSDALKALFPYGFIDTLSPDSLVKSFFKPGSKVNGNSSWTFVEALLTSVDPYAFPHPLPLNAPLNAGPFVGAPEKQKGVEYYSWANDQRETQPYTVVNEYGRNVERFTYTDSNQNNADPGNIRGAPAFWVRSYFDAKLTALGVLKQKRTDTAKYSIVNGSQGVVPGPVKDIVLKCQDITDQGTNVVWQPLTQYQVGTSVYVGINVYQCLVTHQSAGAWGADQKIVLQNGTTETLWQQIPYNAAPLASRLASVYLTTARGEQTVQGAILKGLRMMAASVRNGKVKVRTFLDDKFLTLTTNASVTIQGPTDLIEGGSATGKVTEYEMFSSRDGEYLDVTIECGTGTGLPYTPNPVTYDAGGNVIANPAIGAVGTINLRGQPWDVVAYAEYTGVQPIPTPSFVGIPAMMNDADSQAAFIQANDFNIVAGRTDGKVNDPATLVAKVPTSIQVQFSQLNLAKSLDLQILMTTMAAWSGPKQLDTGAAT